MKQETKRAAVDFVVCLVASGLILFVLILIGFI